MSASFRPSHRNPETMDQLEVCDLCGLLVPHSRMVEADVEGLRGYKICDAHGWERKARFRPSFNDVRAFDVGPYAPEAGVRTEPIGGELWFEDPENL